MLIEEKILEKKKGSKADLIIRIFVVSFASVVMAYNIKTFVHTGGLLPGGLEGRAGREDCGPG